MLLLLQHRENTRSVGEEEERKSVWWPQTAILLLLRSLKDFEGILYHFGGNIMPLLSAYYATLEGSLNCRNLILGRHELITCSFPPHNLP